MPGRHFSAGGYRYGFNGKENDNESGTQDYGMRIYNPGLGKFLSVDPLSKNYPWNSTYAFAENRPIDGTDLEGGEYYSYLYKQTKTGLILISISDYTQTWDGYGDEGPGIKVTVINMKGVKKEQFVKSQPIEGVISKGFNIVVKALADFDAWVVTEPEGNANTSDTHNDFKGDGKANPNDSPDDPYNDKWGPKEKEKMKSKTKDEIVKQEKSTVEIKKNDSIVKENFLYNGKAVDIKVPLEPEADGDTHGLIIEGKYKGKRVMYIDNPPTEKKNK